MHHIIAYFTNASPLQIYGLIFVFLMAGAFGFPFPEEITFLSIGYAVYRGWINPIAGTMVGFLSVLTGDTVIYFLGDKLGLKIFSLPVLRTIITKRAIEKGHALLNRHGSKFVFFSKFVVGLRYSVFFASGMMRIGYKRFIGFDALASLITIPLLATLAYRNGRHINRLADAVKRVDRWVLLIVLTGIAAFIIINYIRNKKKTK